MSGKGIPLTTREWQVVALASRGMSNKQIARELIISEGTVKAHLIKAFQKTGTRNRVELSALARTVDLEWSGSERRLDPRTQRNLPVRLIPRVLLQ